MATSTGSSGSSVPASASNANNRFTNGEEQERDLSREAQEWLKKNVRDREHSDVHTANSTAPSSKQIYGADGSKKQENSQSTYSVEKEEQATLDRRANARRNLEETFKQSGNQYRFKENESAIAFTEERKQIVTKHDSDIVVRGMVDAAQAKGWRVLQIEGTDEFKQKAWLEASKRDMDVRGYKPTEYDKRALEESRVNRIEHAEPSFTAGGAKAHVVGTERTDASARTPDKVVTEARGTPTAPSYEKVTAMGSANYKFDPDESKSYYVTLATANGKERTVWGKDLERATNDAGVNIGDEVRLNREHKTAVQVTANVRDGENRVVGQQQVESHLNTWSIQKRDQTRDVGAVADQSPGGPKNQVELVNKPSAREVAAVKSIEERSGELSAVTNNELSKGGARAAVRDDSADLNRIQNAGLKDRATIAIGRNSDGQSSYREELSTVNPALLAKAERATNQLPDEVASSPTDKKKAVALATLDRVVEAKAIPPEVKMKVMAEASREYDARAQHGQAPVVQILDVSAPTPTVERRRAVERAVERDRASPAYNG